MSLRTRYNVWQLERQPYGARPAFLGLTTTHPLFITQQPPGNAEPALGELLWPESISVLDAACRSGSALQAARVAAQHELVFRAGQSYGHVDLVPLVHRAACLAFAKLATGSPPDWLCVMDGTANKVESLLSALPTPSLLLPRKPQVLQLAAPSLLANALRDAGLPRSLVAFQAAALAVELVDAVVALVLCAAATPSRHTRSHRPGDAGPNATTASSPAWCAWRRALHHLALRLARAPRLRRCHRARSLRGCRSTVVHQPAGDRERSCTSELPTTGRHCSTTLACET